jgi:uncharacterized protein
MRVWVDFTNTAHVFVLRPLIERLERRGHQVELTARPLSQTVEALEQWGHPHAVVGGYGGAGKVVKARAAIDRVMRLVRFGARRRFDCALAHGSTELPLACRLLRVPNTTMFDYEWASLQHHVICRAASRVLVPDAIPAERLARYGVRPPRLVRYPGLKEEYYLAGFTADPAVLTDLGLDGRRVLSVVRTPPSYALYLAGADDRLVGQVLARLSADVGTDTVVLARTPRQADAIEALALPRVVVPRRTVDGRSLVALADVVVSAGGTMNREAAVLGTPVWTIFQGRLGAVDELLAREGRLRLLRDPGEIVLVKKRGDGRPVRERDPEDLLRLALPWVSDGRR